MKTQFIFLLLFFSYYHGQAQIHLNDDQFIDSLVLQKMKENHVPSCILSIVQNGDISYTKAYSLADIPGNKPVNPEHSLFRVASITKSFTAMAIMEFVAQGKLDLHEDIQVYLDSLGIDLALQYPISIHHVLSHTSGIEYSDFRISKAAMDDGELSTFVRTSIPKQAYEPGELFSYSNAAYSILGLLIETISGEKYEDYMDRFVRRNFGMFNSTFHQHTKERPLENAVNCFNYQDGKYHVLERQFLRNPSASTLNTTSVDMARFMECILNNKQYNSEASLAFGLAQMWESQYKPASSKEAMGYGFFIDHIKGKKAINHGGGVRGFLSYYTCIPQDSFGIFIAQNIRYGAEGFLWNVQEGLYDYLIEEKEVQNDYVVDEPIDVLRDRYDGIYQHYNVTQTTFEKATRIFGISEKRVKVSDSADVQIDSRLYTPIEKDIFLMQDSDQGWQIGFELDENKRAKFLHQGIFTNYKRIPWYKSYKVTQVILVIGLLLMLFLLFRPINKGWKRAIENRLQRTIQWWVSLLVLVGFTLLIALYTLDVDIRMGTPHSFKLGLWMITLGALLSLSLIYFFIRMFQAKVGTKSTVVNGLINLGIWTIVLLFCQLNLVGFNYY